MQQIYNTDAEALAEVERGRAWGAMVFQKNYSESLVERTETGRYATDYTIESSDIDVQMDMSSESHFTYSIRYDCHFLCSKCNYT